MNKRRRYTYIPTQKPKRVPWTRRSPVPVPVPVPVLPPRKYPLKTWPNFGPQAMPWRFTKPAAPAKKAPPQTETKPQPKPIIPVKPVTVKTMRRRTTRYPRAPWVPIRPPYGTIVKRSPRKRSLSQTVTRTGTGATRSAFKTRGRRMNFRKRVMQMSAQQRYLTTSGGRSGAAYSTQSTITFATLDRDLLDAMKATITGANDTTQFFVKRAKLTQHITNASKSNVYITIYECIYRKDAIGTMRGLFNDGMADVSAGTSGGTYGATPFMSPAFTSNIKIRKIVKFELGQGQSHVHTSTYNVNKVIDGGYLSEIDPNIEYLAGWSQGTMMICRGEPVNDQTTKTTVVPSTTALDVVTTEDITFHYGDPVTRKLTLDSTLVTSGVTEYLMDEGSGEAEVNAQA